MLTALHTKLLITMVVLLTVMAGYMSYQHNLLVQQQRVEAARRKVQQDFQKRMKKYDKQDNTWKDGADAMQKFRLP